MSTDDATNEPFNTDSVPPRPLPPARDSKIIGPGSTPKLGPAETRAQREAKLRRCGLVMLCIMACVLVLAGGAGSIKWDNELTKAFYPNPEHRYATAALNMSSGLLFWIALIGVYLPARWGLKLNVIGCVWYLVGTVLLEIWAGGKVTWAESISDIVFWGTFPIVQILCILIGSSKDPALVRGGGNVGANDA